MTKTRVSETCHGKLHRGLKPLCISYQSIHLIGDAPITGCLALFNSMSIGQCQFVLCNFYINYIVQVPYKGSLCKPLVSGIQYGSANRGCMLTQTTTGVSSRVVIFVSARVSYTIDQSLQGYASPACTRPRRSVHHQQQQNKEDKQELV